MRRVKDILFTFFVGMWGIGAILTGVTLLAPVVIGITMFVRWIGEVGLLVVVATGIALTVVYMLGRYLRYEFEGV